MAKSLAEVLAELAQLAAEREARKRLLTVTHVEGGIIRTMRGFYDAEHQFHELSDDDTTSV